MKWTRSEKADRNFRDARTGGAARGSASGRGGAAAGAGGLGIVGLILALLFGGNVFGGAGGTPSGSALDSVGTTTSTTQQNAVDDTAGQWFNFLLVDVQDFWVDQFTVNNVRYEEATLTLFDTPIRTGCGTALAAIGPHYCPLDKGIYLETGFFEDILARRFGATGDFAQAYVVAHEFGHHVQGELGISSWVRQQQQQADPSQKNDLSVRLELQADCLAGVWARSAQQRGMLDRGDIAEALGAAEAVGDDRIQQSQGQRVDPHTWTHGSAADRQFWFEQGFDTGDTEVCDTFQ